MEIRIPDLGDFDAVEVIEVLVKPGDTVAQDDPLVTLETDKAAMDVPASAAGRIAEIRINVGDRVSAGQVVAVLESADAPAAEESGDSESAPANGGQAPSSEASGSEAPTQQISGGEAGEPQKAAASADAGDAGDAGGSASERTFVTVPDLGDFDAVDVIDVLIGEGDEVAAEQSLVTLETEKAAMDVPAPKAGRVVAVLVKAGDKVSSGDRVAELEVAGSASGDAGSGRPAAAAPGQKAPAAAKPAAAASAAPAVPPADSGKKAASPPQSVPAGSALATVDEKGFANAHASPSVRKLARELGVDLARVSGSGSKGRITEDDVKRWVREFVSRGGTGSGAGLPELPAVDFSKFGEVERQPLTRIQKISGKRLHAVWVNLPHVTHHDSGDITHLEEARQGLKGRADELGIRLTPLAFILRACVLALGEFPRFNASLDADGEHLIVKKYVHLGFAADTPNGLVVPVIRDADRKDVFELARELGELSAKARDGKLKGSDMQGGCFTVSSLGGIGGTGFTPIINAPEVAILGVARSRMEPVWDAKSESFVPRLMLPLSLSYDHRVIDGAEAARFTRRLSELLSQVELLLGSQA